MSLKTRLILPVALIAAAALVIPTWWAQAAAPTVIHVDIDSTAPTPDGSS